MGAFHVSIMIASFADHIIAQVPDDMQVMRCRRLRWRFFMLHNISLKGDSFAAHRVGAWWAVLIVGRKRDIFLLGCPTGKKELIFHS